MNRLAQGVGRGDLHDTVNDISRHFSTRYPAQVEHKGRSEQDESKVDEEGGSLGSTFCRENKREGVSPGDGCEGED